MLVGRFSPTGFEPEHQEYMKKQVDYLLSFDEEETKRLVPNGWQVVKQGVEWGLKNLNLTFHYYGIHVFFLPLVEDVVRFQLNHLEGKDRPPYHEKWFEDTTPAYSLGSCYTKSASTLGELLSEGHEGAYIPLF